MIFNSPIENGRPLDFHIVFNQWHVLYFLNSLSYIQKQFTLNVKSRSKLVIRIIEYQTCYLQKVKCKISHSISQQDIVCLGIVMTCMDIKSHIAWVRENDVCSGETPPHLGNYCPGHWHQISHRMNNFISFRRFRWSFLIFKCLENVFSYSRMTFSTL